MRRALLASALLAAAAAAGAGAIRLPEGPGVNVVYAKCQTCHDLQYVVDAKGLLPNQWHAVVLGMKDYGLQATPEEEKQLVQYLSTYLGPNPPAAPAGASNAPAAKADGRAVYEQVCAACHGAEGKGRPGYYPPLAGNADLARDRLFPVLVVLHGMSGPIEVGNRSYDGAMPSFAHLSDAEIAAVVNYVRGAWAGGAAQVSPKVVAEQRRRDMSAEDVHAYRARLEGKPHP